MKDLIKALTIFLKYTDTKYPTHCEHDILYIGDVLYKDVSDKDRNELDKLGFFEYEDGFASYRYGSC